MGIALIDGEEGKEKRKRLNIDAQCCVYGKWCSGAVYLVILVHSPVQAMRDAMYMVNGVLVLCWW